MAMPAPIYAKTALTQFGLKLTGKRWNDTDWQKPELTLDQVNNNPRIVVWPRNPLEKEKLTENGRPMANMPISANMKWQDFFKLLFLVEEIIKQSGPCSYTFGFKAPKWENGEKVKGEFIIRSKLDVGRNAEGQIFIRMYEKGREKCVFVFEDNFWVPIQKDGEDLDVAMNSNLAARSFLKTIEEMSGPNMVKYYVPEVREDQVKKADKLDTSSDMVATGDGWD